MIKLGLIGAGNIIRTRHLPALKKNADLFELVGVIDHLTERAQKLAEQFDIPNFSGLDKNQQLREVSWLSQVDAVIIGTPPFAHAKNVKELLLMGKHVLVEKPFVTDLSHGKALVALAKRKHLVLAVNHNFQFSSSFLKLFQLIRQKKLGDIKSFSCVQITNDKRRLPIWSEQLPLGLFYDETPHAFYLIRKMIGQPLKIEQVYKVKSKTKIQTPQILDIKLTAGPVPGNLYINFESPVCEWYFTVFGEKKLALVDLFRDILIVLPNDGQHLTKEVFITSLLATWQHWTGVMTNGIKYLTGNLYYGIDITQRNFYKAIKSGNLKFVGGMSGEDGLEINKLQFEVVTSIKP